MAPIVPIPRGPNTRGGDDRVIHEILKIGSEQRQRGEIRDADDEDEKRASREIAIAEKRRVHKGLIRSEAVDEKQIERRGGDDRFNEDFAGTKPVELLAAVEQD